ncbi:MAG: sugar ABC transporter permease [Erysipelotrichaceae bacterium]|nr:sugar ABC transporter permease [Erysipelotrichaceae bacterium]MDY6034702.1 sugar ABC transporter permease [Bulleidia sp.]
MNFLKKSLKKYKETIQFQSMVIPALVLYCIFVALPIITTFYFSITNYNKFHIIDYIIVGLKNYGQIFKIEMLKTALVNSGKYAIFMTLFQSLIAIPLAVFLNKKIRFSNLYRVLFFLPAMFSPLVMGYLWQVMLSPGNIGIVNQFLMKFGFEPVQFLNSQNGLNSVIFSQVWQWVGWAVVIYLANLQTIPEDMIEAAKIDGASDTKIFFHLILPLLYPGATVVLVSSLVGGLKVYDIIQAMTGGGPGYATETIISSMIKIGFNEGNYALSAAYGVIFFIIVMVFTLILMYLLRAWERKVS